MLYEIEVLTRDESGSLLNQARNFFQWFSDQGCRVKIHLREAAENRVVLRLELHRGLRKKSELYSFDQLTLIFHRQFAEFIAEHILEEWEPYLVKKFVSQKVVGFSDAAKEAILQKSLHFLHYGEDHTLLPEYVRYEKSCRLCARIEESVETLENTPFDLEGFLRFRMKDFIREIENAIKFSWRCWQNDQEYENFILMLRDFMNEQVCSVEVLHVIFYPNGGFCLWDENGQQLYDKAFKQKQHPGMKEEDLLLSLLLAVAPEKIVWHTGKDSTRTRVLRILKDVFQDRLHTCTDCCLCRSVESLRQHYGPKNMK